MKLKNEIFLVIICTIMISIGLSSCLSSSNDNDKILISREEYDRLVNAPTVKTFEPFYFSQNSTAGDLTWRMITGSDGHDYIEEVYHLFVIHSPECKLCKSQQKFYLLEDNHIPKTDSIK